MRSEIPNVNASTRVSIDKALEGMGKSVQGTIAKMIRTDCEYYQIPISTDESALNLQRDLCLASGLDMEVVL